MYASKWTHFKTLRGKWDDITEMDILHKKEEGISYLFGDNGRYSNLETFFLKKINSK